MGYMFDRVLSQEAQMNSTGESGSGADVQRKEGGAYHGMNVRVLDYGPGPMQGAMHTILRQGSGVDDAVRSWSQGLKENGGFADQTRSAEKCIGYLLEGKEGNR